MSILDVILTGIGLSMDALAVSICKGLAMKKVRLRSAFIIALFFGVFQALMPLIGWVLGIRFKTYIEAFDHWIAFGLLAFLGAKMLFDLIKGEEDEEHSCELKFKELVLLSVATSIDALAVGITMAFLSSGVNIFSAIAIIGLITLVLCFFGVFIGNKFGSRFEKNAKFAGGVILILIGIKILLEHLGVFELISSVF